VPTIPRPSETSAFVPFFRYRGPVVVGRLVFPVGVGLLYSVQMSSGFPRTGFEWTAAHRGPLSGTPTTWTAAVARSRLTPGFGHHTAVASPYLAFLSSPPATVPTARRFAIATTTTRYPAHRLVPYAITLHTYHPRPTAHITTPAVHTACYRRGYRRLHTAANNTTHRTRRTDYLPISTTLVPG